MMRAGNQVKFVICYDNRICHLLQRNYYERIINNEKSYNTIRIYIKNNPIKWWTDHFPLK